MQNENEKLNLADKINDFVQRNRKIIFIITGAVFIFLAGLIVFISLQDVFNKRAISEIEELSRRFDDLRYMSLDDHYSSDMQTLLSDLNDFAKKRKGYAGSKAWSIIGFIHSDKKEWQYAESAWLNAAKTGDKTYLGPLSLFNAAAAAEEQGKYNEAIDLLKKSVEHKFEFPAAPRAQFSIGRLYEKLNNYSAAIEAYRVILINWQDMPVWQHLARSRITELEIR